MIKKNSKILKLKHYLNKIYIPGHKSFHPGFEGITFLNLFQFVKEIFINGNFAIRSAAVSFHLFVGIFPTLIFFLSLIPFLPFEGIQQYILNFSQDILPNIIYERFEKTINDLIVKRFKGLLSIGFILSLYYASLGINTLFTASNNKGNFCSVTISILSRTRASFISKSVIFTYKIQTV